MFWRSLPFEAPLLLSSFFIGHGFLNYKILNVRQTRGQFEPHEKLSCNDSYWTCSYENDDRKMVIYFENIS